VNLRLLFLPCILGLAACQNMPEPYAPPEQRQPIEVQRPYRVSRIVNMDDGDAGIHFVRDIKDLSGNWRWTGKRPAVRIQVRTTEKLHYLIDFTLPDVTFKVTGPVAVSFYVNDHLLDTVHYAASGPQHFDEALPDSHWVEPNAEAIVSAEIDKVWVSPADNNQLGFILQRIGLKEE
jgi:hypothetical protein